jgi:hypothetical protein
MLVLYNIGNNIGNNIDTPPAWLVLVSGLPYTTELGARLQVTVSTPEPGCKPNRWSEQSASGEHFSSHAIRSSQLLVAQQLSGRNRGRRRGEDQN